MNQKITVCFCFLVSLTTLFAQSPHSFGQQLGEAGEKDRWTFEIIRETTMYQQETVLVINVPGLDEGTQSTFRNPIYTRKAAPAVLENGLTRSTFYENADLWMSTNTIDLSNSQKIQLNAIEEEFRQKVKDLIQSQFSKANTDDRHSWELTEKQTAEIEKEFIPLELASERLALDVLLPHQRRMILKTHFSVSGFQSLDSVYGAVGLGLSQNQRSEIHEILGNIEAERKKTRNSLLKNKKDIQKDLWENINAELKEDQQKSLARFKESFLKRLRKRTRFDSENYKIDGIGIEVVSAMITKDGVYVAEPCNLLISVNGVPYGSLELFNHSLGDVELNKLPLVGNQRYLMGIEFTEKEKDTINSLRGKFLSDIASIERSKNNTLNKMFRFARKRHIKKFFWKLSGKCYEVLDKKQREILLENRLGFELFRKEVRVFESGVFCKLLNVSNSQRIKIKKLIKQANELSTSVESLAKKKLKDLDARAEKEVANVMTQYQRDIFDKIR